jgi:hypothetical protein
MMGRNTRRDRPTAGRRIAVASGNLNEDFENICAEINDTGVSTDFFEDDILALLDQMTPVQVAMAWGVVDVIMAPGPSRDAVRALLP